MIGDLGSGPADEPDAHWRPVAAVCLPPFPPPKPPGVPGSRGATLVIPSIRDIKISEDQSPRPQDRVYFTFNYFQGVNDQVNTRLQAPIGYTQVFRYIAGFEKTFLDGQGSIGIRVPLDSVTANTRLVARIGQFWRHQHGRRGHEHLRQIRLARKPRDRKPALRRASQSRRRPARADSRALIRSPPRRTAPASSRSWATSTTPADSTSTVSPSWTSRRPATTPSCSTTISGSATSSAGPIPMPCLRRCISMIAPTFEVHVTDPLNHRNPYSLRDPAGMTDIVNLTYGINIGIFERTLITFGVVTPVTSPKPFDFEAMAFVNYFFGARRRPQLATPPVLGGY